MSFLSAGGTRTVHKQPRHPVAASSSSCLDPPHSSFRSVSELLFLSHLKAPSRSSDVKEKKITSDEEVTISYSMSLRSGGIVSDV